MSQYGRFVLVKSLCIKNKVGGLHGKMLILTFEDSEEEILNHIISCVNMGSKSISSN